MSKIKDMKLRYKVAASVATGAVVLSAAGGAYAYVTGGSGSGAGSATATAPLENNLVTTASIASPVTFGGSQAISIKVHNPNNYSLGWAGDSVAIASVSPTSCAADFSVTGASTGSGIVGASTDKTYTSGWTLNFLDLGTSTDQTSCEAATVTFTSGVS